jgi:hypothetical protein
MHTIYVSNDGSDQNDGLSVKTPIHSWKRYMTLSRGNYALHLMEGDATFKRLKEESKAPRQDQWS